MDFDSAGRTSGIRVYPRLGVVVFETTLTAASTGAGPFPVLRQLPRLPYSLSYRDTPFSPYQLNTLAEAPDSPWLFFDDADNAFLLSPASNFPIARLHAGPDGALSSVLDVDLATLASPVPQRTMLVIGSGVNHLFDVWGQALTALYGKTRPSNDADLTLRTFGYWTDNGASYYYRFEPSLGYAGTLLAVASELHQRGIALGYLQLDSWWYPKGANARWDNRDGGIYRYRAAPSTAQPATRLSASPPPQLAPQRDEEPSQLVMLESTCRWRQRGRGHH